MQTWRRLVRSLGLYGVFTIAFVAFAGSLLAIGAVDSLPAPVLGKLLVVLIGLGLIAANWGTYVRSGRVRAAEPFVDGLVASGEEFCLLLRPFGSDGTALGRYRRRVTWTLEQVVAEAVRRELGMPLYAIVDQGLTLAPPGPVYLRAGSTWQDVVAPMIVRAHTIVFVLAPDQQVRPALRWELDRIVEAGRQARVVLLLPPPGSGSAAHRAELQAAQRQTAALVVALLCRSRATASVTAADVARAALDIAADAFVVQVRAYGPDHRAASWVLLPPERGRLGRLPARGPGQLSTSAYDDALREPLTHNRLRLMDLSFEERYRVGRRADA